MAHKFGDALSVQVHIFHAVRDQTDQEAHRFHGELVHRLVVWRRLPEEPQEIGMSFEQADGGKFNEII